jgi:hypothetical protein
MMATTTKAAQDPVIVTLIRRLLNGDQKESQRQNQGKAQENPHHQGDHAQKDRDGQKKAGEEGAGPANITQESQADREGRGQAYASQPRQRSP